MAPLTRDQLIELAAAFGPSIISGIGQGGQAAADRALTEQDRARQAEQEAYNRRMGARAGLAGFFQNQLTRDINAAGDFAAQSPLGAEQALARQMARQRAGAEAVRQYKPPTGMSPAASAFAAQQQNFLAPFASADYQATVSPEATARSIAERRKALAGIDPNFRFGSMGDFGLPDLGGEVSQYQGDVRSRRQASEMDLQRLLTEQMREASAAQIPGATSATAAPTTGAATTQKKPSLLRRIAGAALPVAAAFIPGVGPVASALIQAGAGAAGSAIAGGGLKGALTGAAMGGLGAATGGLGSAASRMGAGGVKEGLGSFVQRAILDPRALTQIAGGAIGGGTGAALQAASLGMPGAQQAPVQGQTFLDTTSAVYGQRPRGTGGVTFGEPSNMGDGSGAFDAMQALGGAAALNPVAQFVATARAVPGRAAASTPSATAPAQTRASLGDIIQQNLRAGLSGEEALLNLATQRPDDFLPLLNPEFVAALNDPARRQSIARQLAGPRRKETLVPNAEMRPWSEVGYLDRLAGAVATPGIAPWMIPYMVMGDLPPAPPRAVDLMLRRK